MCILFILILVLVKMCAADEAEIGVATCKLDIQVLTETVRFTLTVFNYTDTRSILQFRTAQQYDFIVKTKGDEIIWQWSNGKMFADMLTTIELDPSEKKKFAEDYSLPAGEYKAMGIVPATPEKISSGWKRFTVSESRGVSSIKGRITRIADNLYFLGKDGIAYHIVNPTKEIIGMEGQSIEVISCDTEPIPGTVDKKIKIKEFRKY